MLVRRLDGDPVKGWFQKNIFIGNPQKIRQMTHNGFRLVYQTLKLNDADAITKLFPGSLLPLGHFFSSGRVLIQHPRRSAVRHLEAETNQFTGSLMIEISLPSGYISKKLFPCLVLQCSTRVHKL